MIPLLVVLTATGLLFLAVVEMAFGLLMRLPRRLEAERETENGALSAYLDDPVKFFVPARVLRGVLLVLLIVFLAQPVGRGVPGGLILFLSGFGITLLVGQILPALIVRRSPERFLEILLPPFTVLANAIAPLTALIIAWIGPTYARNGNGDGGRHQADAPGDDTAADQSGDENRLLRSVVDFGETLVREVMTPRPDIVAIEAEATVGGLRRLVREQEYSRLPVFSGNLDNIVGLIVVKDLIQTIGEPDESQRVTELMRPAAFVPETKRVVELLREFQQGRFQLAIVVDEYGGTAGLVTVEDVLEELVGEIRDEYDSEADPIVRETDDTFVFSAKVGIGDMAERLGLEIEEGEFETVGGFVLSRVGRVPAVGERFELAEEGLEVEILEAERRRIHKVRIRRRAAAPAVEGAM
jgi:CBS domain containing-hemolysin-like protein